MNHGTEPSSGFDGTICRHSVEDRSFLVIDDDIKTGQSDLSDTVHDGVVHRGGSDWEEGSRLVGSIEVSDRAVVEYDRRSPAHIGSTLTVIIRDRHRQWHVDQGRHFCIDNNHGERGLECITREVGYGVFHGGLTHRECEP